MLSTYFEQQNLFEIFEVSFIVRRKNDDETDTTDHIIYYMTVDSL